MVIFIGKNSSAAKDSATSIPMYIISTRQQLLKKVGDIVPGRDGSMGTGTPPPSYPITRAN